VYPVGMEGQGQCVGRQRFDAMAMTSSRARDRDSMQCALTIFGALPEKFSMIHVPRFIKQGCSVAAPKRIREKFTARPKLIREHFTALLANYLLHSYVSTTL